MWDLAVYDAFGCGITQSSSCLVVGSLTYFGMNLLQLWMQKVLKPDESGRRFSRKQITFFVISRAFIVVGVLVNTRLWKGAWEVLDHLETLWSNTMNIVVFVVTASVLIGTQSFYCCQGSIIGLGYGVDIDHR